MASSSFRLLPAVLAGKSTVHKVDVYKSLPRQCFTWLLQCRSIYSTIYPLKIGKSEFTKELERSKVRQSDERTIYEVQQGRVMIGAMDYHSMQMSGGVGALDDGMVQQRLHALARQRDALARQRDALTRQGDEVQQRKIELKAQVIARSEIMELQNSFEIRMKEQVHLAVKL
ncbi:hypothetical protein Droror1_Dr00026591 [Drosera rotundifolia]